MMWRPGVSLIIMDALLDESSQDMFARGGKNRV